MRIGTWNLELCPRSDSPRGRAIAAWLDGQQADVWLLTEVNRGWDAGGRSFAVSPARGCAPGDRRWAGVVTGLPLGELSTVGDPRHPAEEGLCLSRLSIGGPGRSVLVACSVLPWKGAGKYWPGLPLVQFDEFAYVLGHHVSRITAERRPGEPLIWGGDFNQPLTPPFTGATKDGAEALREAFDELGLVPLTERSEHLNGSLFAIDHLAVSRELVSDPLATVHRPTWDGVQLSDHAAYVAEIRDEPVPVASAAESLAG